MLSSQEKLVELLASLKAEQVIHINPDTCEWVFSNKARFVATTVGQALLDYTQDAEVIEPKKITNKKTKGGE